MKRKGYTSTRAKSFVLALGLVVLPLAVASQIQAKNPGSRPSRSMLAVFYLDNHSGLNVNNPNEIRTRLNNLLIRNARLGRKSPDGPAKGCGCTAVAPDEIGQGFWTCLKGCMADAGVSFYSLIMCGASCAAAETGIGAIVCAICTGASITVVEVCAMGCASRGGKHYGELMEARAPKQRRSSSTALQAKLRLQPS